MTSEKRSELVGCQANTGQDLTQGAPRNVLTRMDRHSNRTAVRMPHEMMAAPDARYGEADALQSLYDLCARYRRNGARHKAVRYYKSGHVERQSHLVGCPYLFKQEFQSFAKVGERSFARRSVAESGDTWTELSGGAPDAVLVWLDDVGHMHDTSHATDYSTVSAD